MKKAKGIIKIKHGAGINIVCFALAGKIFMDSLIKLDKWAKEDELAKATEKTLAAFEKLQEHIDRFEMKKPESDDNE